MSRQEIEAVAGRVVELLQGLESSLDSPGKLVDAAAVAQLLGVTRGTVYANADQLGAIRMGTGKRARLRFDPTRLPITDPRTEPGRVVRPAGRRRRPGKPRNSAVHLLPIHGGAPGAKRRRLSAQSGR